MSKKIEHDIYFKIKSERFDLSHNEAKLIDDKKKLIS